MMLPESTVFLAKRNRVGALNEINTILKRFGRPTLDQLPAIDPVEKNGGLKEVAELFSVRYRVRTVLIWLSFFSLLTLLYFMLTWTPKILVDLGFSDAQGNQGGRMINLVGMLGIAIMGLLSLRFKPELVTSVYMAALFLVLIILSSVPAEFSIMIVLISVVGMLMHGSMIGLYSTTPSLYAAGVRATGTGWAIGLSRFGAVLGPILAGFLLDAGWSAQSLFKAFSVLAVLTSIFSALIYWDLSRSEIKT
jgi:MFS family permease